MLDWRGNLCAHIMYAERTKHQIGKTVKKYTQSTPENAMDFV
jgi:hypothetical protein